MRKNMLYVLTLMCCCSMVSCSTEDPLVEIAATSTALPVIPSETSSCLAQKNATTEGIEKDISQQYFKIPTISFVKKNLANKVVIFKATVTVQIPGASEYVCELGGDDLSALSLTWWNSAGREAQIPAGTQVLTTDCALYCGGIDTKTTFSATGTLEVTGVEVNPATGEEKAVQTQTSISIYR